MKMITRQDIKQGEKYPQKTFISFGYSLDKYHVSDCQTLAEWEQLEGKDRIDGWYVKIEIPFTRNKLYINPNTFEKEVGPTRYTIRFLYRLADRGRGPIKRLDRGWFPI